MAVSSTALAALTWATLSLSATEVKIANGKPAILETSELAGFESLPSGRKKLIETAIAVARNSPWLPYSYGGADPARGGFDCSGAMYYVMTQSGLTPPRTAAGQYLWLGEHKRLHIMPQDVTTTDDPSLAWLQPGDLLFWATAPSTQEVQTININHVAMYLGREKKDGLQIMINSTDGRSYRGSVANGYGVYDFRVPRKGSKSKLVGYGSPPGIPEIINPNPGEISP